MSLLLTDAERNGLARMLPKWGVTEDGKALGRDFRFADFSEAWGFMCRVALLAERMDHHPEWTNIYNRVAIRLNTHSAGGKVTAKDVELARRLEAVILSKV